MLLYHASLPNSNVLNLFIYLTSSYYLPMKDFFPALVLVPYSYLHISYLSTYLSIYQRTHLILSIHLPISLPIQLQPPIDLPIHLTFMPRISLSTCERVSHPSSINSKHTNLFYSTLLHPSTLLILTYFVSVHLPIYFSIHLHIYPSNLSRTNYLPTYERISRPCSINSNHPLRRNKQMRQLRHNKRTFIA